ncbi:hypothetical protein [Flavobacterium soyae]|uniref:Uncharacterized protein n=1 Tax=Flavobacterium soyae TaxID=2903098 RepID=A0ABZ2UF84_9FLAO
MKALLLTLLIFIFSNFKLIAQIEATTNDGKKIILNNDGTWKFKESSTKKTNETDATTDNCSKYIVTQVDKMTGRSSTSSKKILIVSKDGGKKGFGIFLLKSDKSIILSIQAVGAGGCIDDDGKMNVLFRDGTRLELSNDGKFNCESKYTQYFGGGFAHEEELSLFQTKEIETIRIWTSKSFVEENFTDAQSIELMKSFNCLSN